MSPEDMTALLKEASDRESSSSSDGAPMRSRDQMANELDYLRVRSANLTKSLNEAKEALERLRAAFAGRGGSLIELPIIGVYQEQKVDSDSTRIAIHIDVDRFTLVQKPELVRMVKEMNDKKRIALILPGDPEPEQLEPPEDKPKGELAGSW